MKHGKQTMTNRICSTFDKHRQSKNKRGSGSVLVVVKDWLANHCVRLYDNFDDCVVHFVSKELTQFKEDVLIICVYVSPVH